MINTRLEIHIIHFFDIYQNETKEYYYIQYSPTDLVYRMKSEDCKYLGDCNSFVQKYAFKHMKIVDFNNVVNSVLKTINEGKENDTQVVIGFYKKDVSHLNKEVRYDYNGRLFSLKNRLSFNRELNDIEIGKLKEAMIKNFRLTSGGL
jgi:hypothetical protein